MDKANKNELIAVAAYMNIKRTEQAKRFYNQKSTSTRAIICNFIKINAKDFITVF